MVQEREIDIPQTEVIREFFAEANKIDILNQYRQGILAIERCWKTQSWEVIPICDGNDTC
jgi:hypothetical protein